MINTAIIIITMSMASSISPIAQSSINAMTIESTNTNGTGSTSITVLTSAFCMFVMSETVLVVTDAVPKVRKSETASSSDFL